ncbi:MAG: Hsp20/alpha crystallin family protein [Synechococcus sp.]
MTLVRWNPAQEIESIRQELDRAFSSTFTDPNRESYTGPTLQVWETSEAYVARLVVVDADADSFDIEAFPYGLAISGTISPRIPDNAKLVYGEYKDGDFTRKFRVATQIDTETVSANYADGVLTVTLPKVSRSRTVKVALNNVDTAD